MDADARSLLASPARRAPCPWRRPAAARPPAPAASQAPSSAAAQSWSPPPKSTETPPLEGRRRRPGEQRDVARRALEQEGDRVGHRAVPREVLGGIDHRHVGLVRQRQTAPCRRRGSARRRRRPGHVTPLASRSSRAGARGRDGVGEQLLARDDLRDEQLVAAERGESACRRRPGGPAPRRPTRPGARSGRRPAARRRAGRPGASRLGSCWRTRRSSSFSAGVGSRPNASTSAARPSRNLARASACRPAR